MSQILESALSAEQREACAVNDAELEAARIQADLDYLAKREQRFRETLRVLHEMECNELRAIRRAGL